MKLTASTDYLDYLPRSSEVGVHTNTEDMKYECMLIVRYDKTGQTTSYTIL